MPIKAIRQYAQLVADGYRNEEERLALMEAHRAEATARIAELQKNLWRAGWSAAGRTRGDFRARCSQAPRAPASLDPGRDRTVVA